MEDHIIRIGKQCTRTNILKECLPVLFVSVLFSALIYGICKLDILYGILLFLLLFIILFICLLPQGFGHYWEISNNGIGFEHIKKADKLPIIWNTLFSSPKKEALTYSRKEDIDSIKIVYSKNTLSGPAKRSADMFYFIVNVNSKHKRFDLTHIGDETASAIIKMLPQLCDHIEDKDHVQYAIAHNINLYDFMYKEHTETSSI